jgi:xanthine dehydrogenase accessory factor
MQSVDLEVLRTAVSWLRGGEQVTLATLVETVGSAPRPLGALLAVRGDGALAGSVSGGCVEEDLIERIVGGEFANLPQAIRYGGEPEQAQRHKLPCGSSMQVVVERVHERENLEAVLASIERGESISRRLDIASGEVSLVPAASAQVLAFDGKTLTRAFGPQWRLLLIGAGQVSSYLARMALALDYAVMVCDPREEYAATWEVPDCQFRREMPDDLVRELKLDGASAVLALTHDARIDDLALMEALKSDAFYVGALGSKTNNAARRERLLQFDLTPEQVARLRGPVGLPIGARSPPEIALSILAELTALRNGIGSTSARSSPGPRQSS